MFSRDILKGGNIGVRWCSRGVLAVEGGKIPWSYICIYDTHTLFLLQDIPFLVLSGVYTNDLGTLNVSTFFSLTVSLVGIISYFFYLFLERHNIPSYLSWLRDEAVKLKSSSKIRGTPQEGQPPVVGGVSVVGGAQAGSGPRSGGRSPHGSTGGSEHSDGGNSQVCSWHSPNVHFTSVYPSTYILYINT